jgi:ABC-2 type transport system permease protein
MPQFGMLVVLVLLPLQMLSGGNTPRESMPKFVQDVMLAARRRILSNWAMPSCFAGGYVSRLAEPAGRRGHRRCLFAIALARFRKTISAMAWEGYSGVDKDRTCA